MSRFSVTDPTSGPGHAGLVDVYLSVRVWTALAASATDVAFALTGSDPMFWLLALFPLPTLLHGTLGRAVPTPSVSLPLAIDITAIGAFVTVVAAPEVTVAWCLLALSVTGVLTAGRRLALMFSLIGAWAAVAFVSEVVGGGLDPADPVVGVFVATQVVTPAAALAWMIVRMMGRLRRLEGERNVLVAGLTHDVKNSLTGAVGLTDLLSDQIAELDPDEIGELAATAGRETREAVDLIDDLLTMHRAEAGRLEVSREPVDLAAEVARVVAACRTPVELDWDDPAAHGLADPGRVRQIVRNLVSNAFRHGGDRIRVRVGSRQDLAWIAVADDGDPIPESDRELIFDPYRRSGDGEHGKSVGLGLAISRHLARLMGGDLHYRHTGEESVFELTMPWAPGPDRSRPRARVNSPGS